MFGVNATNLQYNTPIHLSSAESVQSYAFIDMIERMRWSSSSVKSIRDTEQETLPQHQEAQSSLASDHFTKLALHKVFYTQILKNAFERFLDLL